MEREPGWKFALELDRFLAEQEDLSQRLDNSELEIQQIRELLGIHHEQVLSLNDQVNEWADSIDESNRPLVQFRKVPRSRRSRPLGPASVRTPPMGSYRRTPVDATPLDFKSPKWQYESPVFEGEHLPIIPYTPPSQSSQTPLPSPRRRLFSSPTYSSPGISEDDFQRGLDIDTSLNEEYLSPPPLSGLQRSHLARTSTPKKPSAMRYMPRSSSGASPWPQ